MKKIMFNDKYGLTKAVLEGRKTQTRRICAFGSNTYEKAYRKLLSNYKDGARFNNELLKCSTYKVGEEVAVAQCYNDTWKRTGYMSELEAKHCPGYNNKMFVKAEKMPHRIKIINVRIERLQDISDEDCLKEGVERCETPTCHNNYCTRDCDDCAPSPREAYAALIDKICGKGTWDSNPYVFVYDFELVK